MARKKISAEKQKFIFDNWRTMAVKDIAATLLITAPTVRAFKYINHLAREERPWTQEQIQLLRGIYSDTKHEINLKSYVSIVGRSVEAMLMKAQKLRLVSAPGVRSRKPEDCCFKTKKKVWWKSLSPEEHKLQISLQRKKIIQEKGHPRGYRELRVCPSCGRFFEKEHSSPNKHCSLGCGMIKREAQKVFTRCRGGKREDLNGQYFRSSYEANYARYLNFLIDNSTSDILRWEFEPDCFEFKKIKRGTRSYTPDFKVYLKSGHIEYHEVKGWDYPKGITARKRFAKYYPHLKLILIDQDFFSALKRQGITGLIPEWETKKQSRLIIQEAE